MMEVDVLIVTGRALRKHRMYDQKRGPALGQIAARTPPRLVSMHVVANGKSKTLPNGPDLQATDAIKRLSVREAIRRLSACPHGNAVLTGDFSQSGVRPWRFRH